MKLSWGTLIPVSAVGGAVAVGLYIGVLRADTNANASDISRHDAAIVELQKKAQEREEIYNKNLERIDRRLSRMEGHFNIPVPAEDR